MPSREYPTSPPPPRDPSPLVTSATEVAPKSSKQIPVQIPPAGSGHLTPFPATAPTSSAPTPQAVPKRAFDDFDDFDDLAEAKEADKTGSDLDFGYKGADDEFSPIFDSPAASMTTKMASSQQTPVAASLSFHSETTGSNGFARYQSALGSSSVVDDTSSVQQSPQNGQHDWDAIFSGLDKSKQIDMSLNASDPWVELTSDGFDGALNTSSAAQAFASEATTRPALPPGSLPAPAPQTVPNRGGALTPGTEHDDPMLMRLTGMGYPRAQALSTLQEFDYDIDRAVDHSTSQ